MEDDFVIVDGEKVRKLRPATAVEDVIFDNLASSLCDRCGEPLGGGVFLYDRRDSRKERVLCLECAISEGYLPDPPPG